MSIVPPDNYIKTLNKTGVSTRYLDSVARAGLEFSRGKLKPVLDLGCGLGSISTALLAQGNHVVANDVEQGHLDALLKSGGRMIKFFIFTGLFLGMTAYGESLSAAHCSVQGGDDAIPFELVKEQGYSSSQPTIEKKRISWCQVFFYGELFLRFFGSLGQ